MSTLAAILCNYNHGPYLERALEAMVTQSRPPDQVIVVDDGSTDNSVSIIESWASKYPSILFLKNERNMGFHPSWSRALAAATADYLYSGAADDYILPGFFESVCGMLDAHPQANIACAMMVKQRADGTRIACDGFQHFSEAAYIPPDEYRRLCLDAEPATHSLSGATIYRRSALLQVGGWRKELGPWADTFSIRALGLKSGICYVPREGTVWVVHQAGMSQSNQRNAAKSLAMIRTAAALMRSPEFASTFPADHVRLWERRFFESLVHQQLHASYHETIGTCGTKKLYQWPICLPVQFARFMASACRTAWSLGVVNTTLTACKLSMAALHRRLRRVSPVE